MAPGGGEKGVGRRDDFVAVADAGGHQAHEQRVGSRCDADAMGALRITGDGLFAFLDLRAEMKYCDSNTSGDCRVNFRLDGFILGLEIEQWNIHGAYPVQGN